MAIFEIYDVAGSGFNMPASSANGYVLSSGPPLNIVPIFDTGSLAYFAVIGSSQFDSISVSYAVNGDTLRIDDIEYYKGDWTVVQMLDLNLVGSISNLSSGGILYAELNMGDDFFGGNNYVDIIHGGPGNDIIYGYGAGDRLYGDAGHDSIFGDDGNDVIYGGSGDDLVDGLRGNDELWGGSGYDTFCFGKGYGRDTVRDFSIAQGDDFFIDKALVKNFKKLKKVAEKYKGGVLLDFKGADDLHIAGIKKKHLNKIDFDFFYF